MRKQEEVRKMLTEKISQYRHPLQELEIQYPANKGKNFTEDEDRFLVSFGQSAGAAHNNLAVHVYSACYLGEARLRPGRGVRQAQDRTSLSQAVQFRLVHQI